MNTNNTNPILPASGVSRCHTASSVTHPSGVDEVAAPNPDPSGRAASNGGTREAVKCLIKAKKNLIFSTFNARTLRKRHNLDELVVKVPVNL